MPIPLSNSSLSSLRTLVSSILSIRTVNMTIPCCSHSWEYLSIRSIQNNKNDYFILPTFIPSLTLFLSLWDASFWPIWFSFALKNFFNICFFNWDIIDMSYWVRLRCATCCFDMYVLQSGYHVMLTPPSCPMIIISFFVVRPFKIEFCSQFEVYNMVLLTIIIKLCIRSLEFTNLFTAVCFFWLTSP